MKTNEKKTQSNSLKKKIRKSSSLRPHRKPSQSKRKNFNKAQSSNIRSHKAVKKDFPKGDIPSAKENIQSQLLKGLEIKYKDLEKKYQFLQAEYANYKKQSLKKIEDLRKYDGETVIQSFIHNVQDNFERAFEVNVTAESIDDFKRGVEMIYANLKKILSEAGVKELDCEGEQFDPVKHSAIGSESSDTIPTEHIIHVVKKAYMFHDKILRPAEVIISNGKSKKDIEEETGE